MPSSSEQDSFSPLSLSNDSTDPPDVKLAAILLMALLLIHNFFLAMSHWKNTNALILDGHQIKTVKEIRILSIVTMISFLIYNTIVFFSSFTYIFDLLNIACSSISLILQIGFIFVKTINYMLLYKTYINFSFHDHLKRKHYYRIFTLTLLLFEGFITIWIIYKASNAYHNDEKYQDENESKYFLIAGEFKLLFIIFMYCIMGF